MKKLNFTFIFFLSLFCLPLVAQHTVVLSGITFSPDNLTINVGETVTWDNQAGVHNVNGSQQSYPNNPESIGNGGAANAPWTYSHTFTMPGTYDYHCDPHFGVGMTGVITVNAAPPAMSDIVITEIFYNTPGPEVLEYVELYNNSANAIDMEGWVLSDAINFTFPAFTLGAGEYIVIVNDLYQFGTLFSVMAFEFTGALNNTGETITLSNASGDLVDAVEYSSSAPWPGAANGFGSSLSLCDVNADNNDAQNWAASITPTGIELGGTEILATPGAVNECPAGPIINFLISNVSVPENAGNLFVTAVLSNGNANSTDVTVELNGNSTASNGDDYSISLPAGITFTAGAVTDTQTISITIIDDMDMESLETIILELTNPTNNGIISPVGSVYTATIIDNDTPSSDAMVISGVFDTQPAGAGVKGLELKALADIPDLSVFGVGSANNGGGSGGEETSLPAISILAGECVYVVDDSIKFVEFFGNADYIIEGDAANINGDDAIELFENNIPSDIFGDINTDGSGEPWEYTDGWVYRISGTGPDGTSFQLNNWTFSGIDVFDDVPNNGSASSPFPICSYSGMAPTMPIANDDNASVDINGTVTVNVLSNDLMPNTITSMTITSDPDNGTAVVNGLNDITYTPNPDFCGQDGFIYEICDMNGCDEAFVTVTIACPASYPPYDIALVTATDATGNIDSLGVTCQLQGIVHGIDLQGNESIQFTFIDNTGGISLFSGNNFNYTVAEGDEVIVRGTISEFNCLGQITPDTVILVSSGNDLETPTVTTFLGEDFESELIRLTNLTFVDPAEWLGDGNSFNVQVTNGSFTNVMRIDNDTELSSMPIPQEPFHAIGIGGQFDNDGPCDGGYQFLPRYMEDIEELTAVVDPTLAQKIQFFPNPVSQTLTIRTDLKLANVQIANLLGQVVLAQANPQEALDVSDLGQGIYLITFQVGETIWTDKLVKE